MDVAPLVSAYRYRFHVLDVYGGRMGGLTRPAGTIEDALRQAAAELKLVADPPAQLKRLAHRINAETRAALRDVIARAENDLAIAITRFGTDIGAPPTGPHIDLRASLDGLDRAYRASDPAPDDFDGWYDQLDAQISHLSALVQLEKELETARGGGASVRVPDPSPRRLKWFLVVLVVAALAALGIAGLTTFNQPAGEAAAPPPVQPAGGAEQPRLVRTVPITVAPPTAESVPPPPAATAAACRTLDMEVSPGGATLVDAPLGGQPVVRLEEGEKVQLRQVVELGPNRLIEVEVPARSARGFLGEREARLPVMTWTCDR
ncbi:hypothetical protein [Phreatobacter cathodiphilus]|uniref:Uncharacterized protein n=1 Tax=Phreatobacter cathodiphilus TaxID=1868589 RepID=A0A2S0NGJ7_9HYPH|nr:hypothetical protein [Phreatobacter cathodiphilus]AVO47268.1 hypothetical protein C6569_20710 [Phreatobacter cathodiphilus]